MQSNNVLEIKDVAQVNFGKSLISLLSDIVRAECMLFQTIIESYS